MQELHDRLCSLGFSTVAEHGGVYDDVTVTLVEAFQRSRGLPLTGAVDAVTWARLVEAGWKLGDRLLYLTTPMLRGDDVAELQVRLSQLGFDPGRIDGVFGPLLHAALSDFQRNCALAVDGTLTRRTLLELRRVSKNLSGRTLVTEAREVANLTPPSRGPVLLWGRSPLVAHLAHGLPDVRHDEAQREWSVEEFAAFANEHGASLVLVIEQHQEIDGVRVHYWASYRSHSRRGERLAGVLARALTDHESPVRLEITGMAVPILRETKMTTLLIEHGPLSSDNYRDLVAALAATVETLVNK